VLACLGRAGCPIHHDVPQRSGRRVSAARQWPARRCRPASADATATRGTWGTARAWFPGPDGQRTGSGTSSPLQHQLVGEAPSPLLAGLQRAHGLAVVSGGVPVRRGIAATNMPATHAQPQVDPAIPGLQAVLTTGRAGHDRVDLIHMRAGAASSSTRRPRSIARLAGVLNAGRPPPGSAVTKCPSAPVGSPSPGALCARAPGRAWPCSRQPPTSMCWSRSYSVQRLSTPAISGSFSSGSCCSIQERSDSSHGGSFNVWPRPSTVSSLVKPGGSVAISNSTPPGSRK
jgi:hypothetical protein